MEWQRTRYKCIGYHVVLSSASDFFLGLESSRSDLLDGKPNIIVDLTCLGNAQKDRRGKKEEPGYPGRKSLFVS